MCRRYTYRECFRADNLTIDKAVKICVAHEASRKQMQVYKEDKTQEVHAVHKKISERKWTDEGKGANKWKECHFCGKNHQWGGDRCPAYGKKCSKSEEFNHFGVKCKTVTERYSKNKKRNSRVQGIEEQETGSEE